MKYPQVFGGVFSFSFSFQPRHHLSGRVMQKRTKKAQINFFFFPKILENAPSNFLEKHTVKQLY